MDLSELENVLAGTLSPDQNVRKAAELHLKKVWFFLVILFCFNELYFGPVFAIYCVSTVGKKIKSK